MMLKNKKEQGKFIIDLMVGLTMSTITILAVFSISSNFEKHKQTTSKISQSVGNAYIGLFVLEKNAKLVGYGLNNINFLGCNVQGYNSETGQNFNFPLKPITINFKESNKESDDFILLFGSANNYFSPLKITNNFTSNNETLLLESRFGIEPGDVFVIGRGTEEPCYLAQVSELPYYGSSQVEYNQEAYGSSITGYRNTKYNSSFGLPAIPLSQSIFLNLGQKPQRQHYYIDNNKLIKNNLFGGEDNISVLADNIVLMKAVYAIDNDYDGSVDEWITEEKPIEESNKVIGFRVGLVVQSPNKERECNVTTNPELEWLGGTMDISDIEDYQCYRYRVLQATIPFKNIIWKY